MNALETPPATHSLRHAGDEPARMDLWLVRHAQPLVDAGICYGRLDVAADAGATAECAQALAQWLPASSRVISSPLQRCEQLAHALYALRPDLSYKTDARLQEMDFGQWEGRAWNDIGAAALDAWVADFALHRPGDGESVQVFMQRVAELWDEASAAAPAAGADRAAGAGTLWITHAGVLRAVSLLEHGIRCISRADQWPRAALGFGQWRRLALARNDRPEPAGVNDQGG
ncbi:alpha-ribazole phosphatase [Polaromonas sp. CG_9.7]|uniref:histidine phosphatase family protein n=2 Tax=Polaromonas TaxID=52972 RepID=UPI001A34E621|nr:alpha-ribazole phosphatase [Polaromonas sp. CG_9.7]MBG6113825.1 alpha-ribazole phosphatase [Polaromonas sp. CG_9.2]MDH6183742.1 alpha-ribazole phosphatase [Polaromonas sp. CG_23.6]